MSLEALSILFSWITFPFIALFLLLSFLSILETFTGVFSIHKRIFFLMRRDKISYKEACEFVRKEI